MYGADLRQLIVKRFFDSFGIVSIFTDYQFLAFSTHCILKRMFKGRSCYIFGLHSLPRAKSAFTIKIEGVEDPRSAAACRKRTFVASDTFVLCP